MSYSKQREARFEADANRQEEAPPAYAHGEDPAAGPSITDGFRPDDTAQPSPSLTTASSHQHGLTSQPSTKEPLPTAESPFNFPSANPLPPAYTDGAASSSSSSAAQISRPIAIPQSSAQPTSPFLPAYASLLLTHGITQQSFLAFLSTISAFLTAKVSDRALAHTVDMARRMADYPTGAFKGIFKHAKVVGKDIGRNAKRGNIVGAAMGVVGGAVTIPLFATGGIISSVVTLPSQAIAAVSKKPKTPRERAAAYVAVANGKWFQARGLFAVLLDTRELAGVLKVAPEDLARPVGEDGLAGQLRDLERYVERLEVEGPAMLELGRETLWLVLSKAITDDGAASTPEAGESSSSVQISGTVAAQGSVSASASSGAEKS